MPETAVVPDDVVRINAWVAAQEAKRGRLMDMDVHGIRRAYTWEPWPDELMAIGVPAAEAPVRPPPETVQRRQVEALGRTVPVYVLRGSSRPVGVLFFVHGGGWMSLRPDDYAPSLWPLARDARLLVVMPDYRLAPEAPFPAAPDDCEAAAQWCIDHVAELGADRLLLAGDSAGANLALTTLLRLRDRLGACPFVAADLRYGVYDLAGTPSLERNREDTLSITRALVKRCVHWYVAGAVDLRSPAVSPLYADLAGLPPALFSVGDRDPLLDDTLFMHARWQQANRNAALAIYAGGHHAFDGYPTASATACTASRRRFLLRALGEAD